MDPQHRRLGKILRLQPRSSLDPVRWMSDNEAGSRLRRRAHAPLVGMQARRRRPVKCGVDVGSPWRLLLYVVGIRLISANAIEGAEGGGSY